MHSVCTRYPRKVARWRICSSGNSKNRSTAGWQRSLRRYCKLSLFHTRTYSLGTNAPYSRISVANSATSPEDEGRSHLVDGLCIHSHPSCCLLAQPLRLCVVEAVFKLPCVPAFNVERLAVNRRIRLYTDDDPRNAFRRLPEKSVFLERGDDGRSHRSVGHAWTDSIHSNVVSLEQSLARGPQQAVNGMLRGLRRISSVIQVALRGSVRT